MITRGAKLDDHFQHPRNVGSFAAGAPGVSVGEVGSTAEGVLIQLGLMREGGRVVAARFRAFGCGHTIACCSWLTEWVVGKSLAESSELAAATLVLGLGLEPDKAASAEWAVRALRAALRVGAAKGVE